MVPHADYKVEPWCTLIWKQELVECWSGINFWTYQLDVAFKSCRASIKGWDIRPWSQWSFVILNVRCLGSIRSDLDDITWILEDQSLQRSVWSNTAKLSCMMQNNLLFRFWSFQAYAQMALNDLHSWRPLSIHLPSLQTSHSSIIKPDLVSCRLSWDQMICHCTTHQHSQRVCLMFQIKHSHSHHLDQCKRHKLPISSDYPSWILHGINSSNFTEPKFLFFLVLATKQNLKSKLGRCLRSCLQREILVGSLPWSLVLGPWGLMSQAARWDAESISWCMEKCRCIDEIWRGTRCLVATPRGKCIFSYQLHSCHGTLTCCWFLAHLESQQIRQKSSKFNSLFQESNMIAMGWMILEVFTPRFFAADLSIFILSLWFLVSAFSQYRVDPFEAQLRNPRLTPKLSWFF